MTKKEQLTTLIERYKQLGIDSQIDYEKFYLYSIITHSTAIEGSTVTEIENQLLFDEGITAKGKPLVEQMMNLDLKRAYEESIRLAKNHTDITVVLLKALSRLVMQNTGSIYNTALGDFSSANGDLRLVNVTAGVGGRSYLSFEAHYRLVTIHPWVDGNGRMARLVMNHIQFEFGLIPSKVLKEDKGDYINALISTREADDMSVFLDFMTGEMIKTLSSDIDAFLRSMGDGGEKTQPIGEKKPKSREKILQLLKDHPNYSARKLAEVIGITPKAV
ncbi:MAG: Fic family protein, partial [Bacteroidales bacterium]|nr:Fic family protein [Bacteroidales bacterium]